MLTEHWSACVVSAACSYNSEPYGIKNIFSLVSKEILYEGFIVLNRDLGNFYDEIPPALAKGEFTKPIEHVTMGLDQGEAFLELLNGGNIGKAVISLE